MAAGGPDEPCFCLSSLLLDLRIFTFGPDRTERSVNFCEESAGFLGSVVVRLAAAGAGLLTLAPAVVLSLTLFVGWEETGKVG